MQVTMYEDTSAAGDSVLIADNGKVSFIEGQPQQEELAVAVMAAMWTDVPAMVAHADKVKGTELARVTAVKLGADIREALGEELGQALREGLEQAAMVASAATKYRKAIAMSLISVDKWDELKRNLALASRDLGSCPPIINLLVRTLEADRLLSTQAQVSMLDATRDVVQRLQGIAKGEPGQAHAAVLALLESMGMPVDGCPCCGEVGHEAPGANAAGYSGKVHVPGSRSVN